MYIKKGNKQRKGKAISRKYELCRDYAIICSGLFLGGSFIKDLFSPKILNIFLVGTFGATLIFAFFMFLFRKSVK